MICHGVQNNLKLSLLAAITVCVTLVSCAHAEEKISPSTGSNQNINTGYTAPIDKSTMGITSPVSATIDPKTGTVTSSSFTGIASAAISLAPIAIQPSTSQAVVLPASSSLMSNSAGGAYAQLNIPTATGTPAPALSHVSLAATAVSSQIKAPARTTQGDSADQNGLSCATLQKAKHTISSPQASRMSQATNGDNKPATMAPQPAQVKPTSATTLVATKPNRTSIIKTAASVIDSFTPARKNLATTKPMTTGNIKIMGKIRSKTTEMANSIARGIIPIFKMAIANDQEPVLTVLYLVENTLPAATSGSNRNDPGLPAEFKGNAGKSNGTIPLLCDTVSSYALGHIKPSYSINSLSIMTDAVNYAKTGLSPPDHSLNSCSSSFFRSSSASISFHPLSLNRITGFNCKGFSIYTNHIIQEDSP